MPLLLMPRPSVGSARPLFGERSSRMLGSALMTNALCVEPPSPATSVAVAVTVYPPAVALAPLGSAPVYDHAVVPFVASDTGVACQAVPFQNLPSPFRSIVIVTVAMPDATS